MKKRDDEPAAVEDNEQVQVQKQIILIVVAVTTMALVSLAVYAILAFLQQLGGAI